MPVYITQVVNTITVQILVPHNQLAGTGWFLSWTLHGSVPLLPT